MAKKRTKRQKSLAKHSFTISWNPKQSEAKNERYVKGQFASEAKIESSISLKAKNSVNSAQTYDYAKIRRNIIKSLILAGIVLGSEIVLYFFWK